LRAEIDAAGYKFDAIHVGAAASELPTRLSSMLKPGGLMMVPVGEQGETQTLCLVRRSADPSSEEIKVREVMHVQFVPLTEPE